MKKAILVQIIASEIGISNKSCNKFVASLLEIITSSLIKHEYVELVDFGIFDVRIKNLREDQESFIDVDISNKNQMRPVFIASEKFIDRINQRVTPDLNMRTTIPTNKLSGVVISNKIKLNSPGFDANLNVKSKLGELGYSIQLPRDTRWLILKEQAIPRYGIKEIRNHIAWLVRLKKKDKHKDYSNAIFEWEYDLKRLDNLS